MQSFPTSPLALLSSTVRHRGLLTGLARREVVGRYRGSLLGLSWSLLTPILMLLVYTFVFGVVFNARWGTSPSESRAEFALVLFVGMLVFNLFAETLLRAPSLILSNVNYVKKVVFPLEILPPVILAAALFHLGVGLLVWLVAHLVLAGLPPLTALLFPLVVLPVALVSLGLAWLLASLGVYLRDVGQAISVLVTALLFLAPVFYPLTAVPEAVRGWFYLNPLTLPIEMARDVLFRGRVPDPLAWAGIFLLGALVAWGGFTWFQKTRKGFADVL
jgi:lipopolysaccharide transport system permease protein